MPIEHDNINAAAAAAAVVPAVPPGLPGSFYLNGPLVFLAPAAHPHAALYPAGDPLILDKKDCSAPAAKAQHGLDIIRGQYGCSIARLAGILRKCQGYKVKDFDGSFVGYLVELPVENGGVSMQVYDGLCRVSNFAPRVKDAYKEQGGIEYDPIFLCLAKGKKRDVNNKLLFVSSDIISKFDLDEPEAIEPDRKLAGSLDPKKIKLTGKGPYQLQLPRRLTALEAFKESLIKNELTIYKSPLEGDEGAVLQITNNSPIGGLMLLMGEDWYVGNKLYEQLRSEFDDVGVEKAAFYIKPQEKLSMCEFKSVLLYLTADALKAMQEDLPAKGYPIDIKPQLEFSGRDADLVGEAVSKAIKCCGEASLGPSASKRARIETPAEPSAAAAASASHTPRQRQLTFWSSRVAASGGAPYGMSL